MENNYQPENNYQAPNYQPDPNCSEAPVQQPVQEPVQQPIQEPIQEPVQTPVQEAAQEPAKKLDLQTVQQTAEKIVKQVSTTAVDIWKKLMALPKAILIGAVAAVLVLAIGVPLLVNGLTNTYKTPVNLAISYMNSKNANAKIDDIVKLLNGFCESEAKSLLKTFKKTDVYDENKDDLIQALEDGIEDMEDEYGKNFKYSYKVEEKDKLEKEDLKEFREELKNLRDQLGDLLDETEDWDSDDWEDLADEMGVSKAQAKNMVADLEKLHKSLKSIKVTNGYELSVVVALNGSELDEPEEEDMEFRVYKVNGRWVSMDTLQLALMSVISSAMSAIDF